MKIMKAWRTIRANYRAWKCFDYNYLQVGFVDEPTRMTRWQRIRYGAYRMLPCPIRFVLEMVVHGQLSIHRLICRWKGYDNSKGAEQ